MDKKRSDQAILNRIWSQLILEELSRFGVLHVCIAPGSRSTPLTLEADRHSDLIVHTHFDERGLGFMALGMAKASQSPVAIVVTSGTAVANLLPAIVEANLTGEKLVVLTADRPIDLIDCGANQAIIQVGIYSNHVNGSLNLPSPSEQIPANWLLTSIDELMYKQIQLGGAVHINCPYPEPLYSEQDKSIYSDYLTGVKSWVAERTPYSQQVCRHFSQVDKALELEKYKGVIIVGKIGLADAEKVSVLAETLGWPILCDPQSGISSAWRHYELWLRNERAKAKLAQCELVVQFGARIISKTLNKFIKQQCGDNNIPYYLVSAGNTRLNPDHLGQRHIHSNITDWVDSSLSQIAQLKNLYYSWADELKIVSKHISGLLPQDREFSELTLASSVPCIVRKHDLFIGNSLIVRLMDMVSALSGCRTYTNRGASGIDGLIATAIGVQKMNQKAMLVVLGDTSLLYDINSLALYTHMMLPSVILVTNNDGGAIFDLLPVPEDKKRSLYQMPHGYHFEYAAKQFGLGYLQPNNMDELIDITSKHLDSGKGALIVEFIPEKQAAKEIERLVKKINALR